jgi:immune inhibitor A
MRVLVATCAAAALALPALGVGAGFDPATAPADRSTLRLDNLPHPLGEQQAELRAKALEMKLEGRASGDVVKVGGKSGGRDFYVELAREDTDRIFVVIAEFGNTRHPAFPDTNPDGTPASDALTFEGPLHNSIPEPDRSVDNSTLWQADYDRGHYEDMYFNRMAKYYESQSSGRYSVDGDVTEWVKVPFNEARYGRDVCGSIVCNNTWFLIRDALAFWVQDRLTVDHWTLQQVTDYLKTFDKWDRYDLDGDGNFDEPDGFIDHFQIVHAGGDQAAGDPQQGTDAIWSHRWYAQISGGGPFGLPGVNAGQGGVSGGLQIPNNPTGVWVGDYTIQPENGGLGVFAHEYGHDLGLPDLYDTSGNTCGSACENSTGFWSLMSSGANIGDGGPDGIGDAPTDMGTWEKLQLGWLNHKVVNPGEKKNIVLGPAEFNSPAPQAIVVNLPDKKVEEHLGTPPAGSNAWYSTSTDNFNTTVTSPAINLPAGSASVALKAWYDIETCWDFAFLEVSTDGGTTFQPVATSASTDTDSGGLNPDGFGITGLSGSPESCDAYGGSPVWVDIAANLDAYAGQTVQLRIRYTTDGFVHGVGFEWDALVVTAGGASVHTEGADPPGWTAAGGFKTTTGVETSFHYNAYMIENRGYRLFDTSLKTAYNFGFLNTKPDWVETFPYQNGVLISYWDSSQGDNSTSAHPGEGLILPVDAHPQVLYRADNAPWRSRIQSYDSTFGWEQTDKIKLHFNSLPSFHGGLPANPLFNDLKDYWSPTTPTASVRVPKTGTKILVVGPFDKIAVVRVEAGKGTG